MRTKGSLGSAILAGALPAAVLLASACLGTDEARVLGIEATGTFQGTVYFDANGNRELDAADSPQAGIGVRLLVRGTPDTLARASSNSEGVVSLSRVPVGSYVIAVDPASVPVSLQVVDISPVQIDFQLADTLTALIAISFPKVSVAEARLLPVGAKVFVEGVALNGQATFNDKIVHLLGASAAIRVTRVGLANISAGDSVRFLGEVAIQDGQPTLEAANSFFLVAVDEPSPTLVTTAAATTADGGILDAALVKVADVTIADTATVEGELILNVDDGSGTLEVLLDQDLVFADSASLVPGTAIDATGLLVPVSGSATWRLKPRGDRDLMLK